MNQLRSRHRRRDNLQPDERLAIIAACAAGAVKKDLAKSYGLSPSQISRILKDSRREEKEAEAIYLDKIQCDFSENLLAMKRLTEERDLLKDELRGLKRAIIASIGGTDFEGNPTSEINNLQLLEKMKFAESSAYEVLNILIKLKEKYL